MTLKDYYKNLSPISPRAAFVARLQGETGRDRATITRWLSGKATPAAKLERELIEKLTGVKIKADEK